MRELSLSRHFSEDELRLLMPRLFSLLAQQAAQYTRGESTSLPVETAQELLASLWHTLTLALEAGGLPYTALLREDLPPLLARGQDLLHEKLSRTQALWEAVCRSAPDLRNFYYEDTLRGIGGYLKHYDLYFFAHHVPPLIDYPLLVPAPESLQGLDYTGRYLRSLLAENLLLRVLDHGAVEQLLRIAAPDPEDYYLNLCEQALTNAIGLCLLGQSGRSVRLCAAEQSRIFETLHPEDPAGRGRMLREAARFLCDDMQISDSWIRGYAAEYAASLLPRLNAAMDAGDVSHVFLAAEAPSP